MTADPGSGRGCAGVIGLAGDGIGWVGGAGRGGAGRGGAGAVAMGISSPDWSDSVLRCAPPEPTGAAPDAATTDVSPSGPLTVRDSTSASAAPGTDGRPSAC